MTLKGTPATKKKLAPLLTPSLTPIYPNKRLDWDKENYDPLLHKFSPTYEQTLSEKEIMRSSLSKTNLKLGGSDALFEPSPTKDITSHHLHGNTVHQSSTWNHSLPRALVDITHIYDSTSTTLIEEPRTPSISRLYPHNNSSNTFTSNSTPQYDDSEIRRLDESSISLSDIVYEDLEWSRVSTDRTDSTLTHGNSLLFIDHSSAAITVLSQDPPPLEDRATMLTYREAAQRRLRRGLR